MSKIFYDHLIVLEEIEAEIKNTAGGPEEREELWQLVDEIIHHRVLGCILDKLPKEHHNEFLTKFHQAPHDEDLITYLKEKSGEDIKDLIRKEIENLNSELLKEIRGQTKK